MSQIHADRCQLKHLALANHFQANSLFILASTDHLRHLRTITSLIVIWLFALQFVSIDSCAAGTPFALRGYYITLMRMPVMGLAEWKQAVDCFADDDANTLILWTAGGFRSKKFPI